MDRHEMPFGAKVLADGGTRFRLWAPAGSGAVFTNVLTNEKIVVRDDHRDICQG